MRKTTWRLLMEAMPREVARFIQSRIGELKISEAKYEALLSEAEERYPKYLEDIRSPLH
jgi:intergrase/recombinase